MKTNRTAARWMLGIVCTFFVFDRMARADDVDALVKNAMAKGKAPGLSLAIVDDGKVVKAQGYGFADREQKIPVTSETLFQAASNSKIVTAMAALKLVEAGKLSLDGAVNDQLRTWKIPANQFT